MNRPAFVPGQCHCDKCPRCGGVDVPHMAINFKEGTEDECYGYEDDRECQCPKCAYDCGFLALPGKDVCGNCLRNNWVVYNGNGVAVASFPTKEEAAEYGKREM